MEFSITFREKEFGEISGRERDGVWSTESADHLDILHLCENIAKLWNMLKCCKNVKML